MSGSRINILMLGGAKRVEITRLLKRAALAEGLECHVTAYELDAHSPIALEGDAVEGLRWSDPGLKNELMDTVVDRDIDIILPFVDPAVGIAAEVAARTAVFTPTSPKKLTDRMFDKVAAAEFFERHGIAIPATYTDGASCGKLIAKPRYGSASKGIVLIDSLPKLYELRSRGADKYLIQERIDHREELTVDCYVGMATGEILAVSPRLRAEVSGGEVVRTETVDDPAAVALAKQVLTAGGLRGAVTVQLIRDLDTGRLMVMEVNPRLGGGVTASIHAGADIASLIVRDSRGLTLSPVAATPGVETVRYLADVVFYPDRAGSTISVDGRDA